MKKSKLPKTDSIDDLAKFWECHELTDFEDELEEVTQPVFLRRDAIQVRLRARGEGCPQAGPSQRHVRGRTRADLDWRTYRPAKWVSLEKTTIHRQAAEMTTGRRRARPYAEDKNYEHYDNCRQPAGCIANDPLWVRRWTVAEYHEMIELGILTPDDRVELLEGWIVNKMSQNPPHRSSVGRVVKRVSRVLPDAWTMSVQGPITLSDSEPEPDITLARGDEEVYDTRHPEPADIGVLIEVGDSTVLDDRRYKGILYAQEKVPEFWLINIPARKVEVYTKPRGGKYQKKVEYTEKQTVQLILDGVKIAQITVRDLMAKS